MQFATTVNGKEKATPKAIGWCPGCSTELITKCGEINIWHWAHKAEEGCDWDTGKMSAWHIEWQEYFNADRREVKVTTSGKRRMADVIAQDGTVLEFQHSSIGAETIKDREGHYKNMAWIFDAADIPDDRFIARGIYIEWKHPRKSWLAACAETFYDLGTGWLWLVNEIVEWDYLRVYGYTVSKDDFIKWAKTGKRKWKSPTWARYTYAERREYDAEKRRIEHEQLMERRGKMAADAIRKRKEAARLMEIDSRQHIGKTYPTEFGGKARVIIQRGDHPQLKTTTGLWWVMRYGILHTP